MSKFITQLDSTLISDSKNEGRGLWQLDSDLVYQSDVAARTITAPKGFQTDYASVPRIPLVFDLMGDYAHAAATIHDYLYTTGEVDRKTADRIFREAAVASGVSHWRAIGLYLGVRLFGGSHYQNK